MARPKHAELVRAAKGDIAAVFAVPMLLPGEREVDHDALRAAHLAELDPRTAYERSLAESLIGYEWEMHRHLKMRDKTLLADYRQLAINLLTKGSIRHLPRQEDVDEENALLARDLLSSDPAIRLAAEEDLKTLTGRDPEELLAQAYARSSAVRAHEAKIVDLERRRRLLREDYQKLKSANALQLADPGSVEDAEVVEAA